MSLQPTLLHRSSAIHFPAATCAAGSFTGTRSRSTRADSTTRRSRRARSVCSASRSDLAARHARWLSFTSQCSMHSSPPTAATPAIRVCLASVAKFRRRQRWHTPRTTLSSRCFRRRRPRSIASWRTVCDGCAIRQSRSSTVFVSVSEQPTRSWTCVPPTGRSTQSRCSVWITTPATSPVTGARIRSVSAASRSARTGVKSGPSC